MKSNAAEQQTIREYLLGQLPGEEQSHFEERLLTENDLLEELEIVEDELVDEYLREELTPADRADFESHFVAAPEHREKLSFARAFRRSLASRVELPSQVPVPAQAGPQVGEDPGTEAPAARAPDRKKPWFDFFGIRNPALGYATAVALVLMVVGTSWVVWRRTSAPRDPGRIVSAVLTPGITRDVTEGPRKIPVSADTDTLRLQLILPDNRYQSYEATLVDAEGRSLTTQPNLTTGTVDGQPAVTFDVPANVVPPGDYRVKLNGIAATGNKEGVATYLLRIQSS